MTENSNNLASKRRIAILMVQSDVDRTEYCNLETWLLCLGFQLESVFCKRETTRVIGSQRFDLAFVNMELRHERLLHAILSIRKYETPVVGFVTSSKRHESTLKSKFGFDDFLVLPVSYDIVLETLKRWIV
ncbi:MAG TPA: hypothetical protein V6C97_23745 [Oculatellaceae cyanobacterium]